MCEFSHIGYAYRLGWPYWSLGRGVVLLGRDACYFVSTIPYGARQWCDPQCVEARLKQAFENYGPDLRNALATNELVTLSNLPPTVTAGESWPFRAEEGNFFALPRRSAIEIAYPLMGNLQIKTPSRRIEVLNWFFRRNKVLRSLRSLNWLDEAT